MHEKHFINDYLINLKPYKTVSQEIWSIDSKNWNEVLKLDWNEATVDPAPEVKETLLQFIKSEEFFHLYPSTYNRELLELLSQYANVPELNVQYFSSSDSLHEYISRLYIASGDKVLILWPSYDNFRSTAEVNGADIVYFDMGESFELDIKKWKECIKKEKPKLVYLCNPNNPTGHLISKKQIKEFLDENPETMFIIDEAYAEFAHQSVNNLALSYENILVTHTMSKAFGLANVRFGYLVSSVDNIDAISRIRNPKNISTLTQIAVIAALSNIDYMWRYVEEVNLAKAEFLKNIQSGVLNKWIRVYPSKGNFVLLKCRDIKLRSKIYYLLREKKIYVRQLGQSASVLNCIRITVGTRDQMEKVYKALCEILLE